MLKTIGTKALDIWCYAGWVILFYVFLWLLIAVASPKTAAWILVKLAMDLAG